MKKSEERLGTQDSRVRSGATKGCEEGGGGQIEGQSARRSTDAVTSSLASTPEAEGHRMRVVSYGKTGRTHMPHCDSTTASSSMEGPLPNSTQALTVVTPCRVRGAVAQAQEPAKRCAHRPISKRLMQTGTDRVYREYASVHTTSLVLRVASRCSKVRAADAPVDAYDA